MAVLSNGNPYGVPDDLVFSFPLKVNNGSYEFIKEIDMSDAFTKKMMQNTIEDLL